MKMRKKGHRFALSILISGLVILGLTGVTLSQPSGEDGVMSLVSEQQNLLPANPSEASPTGEIESREPEFAPGELIVKFKTEKESTSITSEERGEYLKERMNSSSIEALKTKYGVTEVEKVFSEPGWRKLSGSRAITEALDKKFPGFEEKFARRIKRIIAKDAKLPDLSGIHKVKLAKGVDVLTAALEFSQDPNVEYAEPNYMCRITVLPDDPYYRSRGSWGQGYDDLWGLKPDKLDCEHAWDISTGTSEIIVAVVDTGVDYNHEDIKENIWINQGEIAGNGIDDDKNGFIDDLRGWDFANSDNDPIDDNGHGTHCAGTIAAVGDNGVGIVGVTWNSKIMPMKGLDYEGNGYISDLANALCYAADNGADVISNSWGAYGTSQTLEAAVNYAHGLDCVVVAAAGNINTDVSRHTPSNLENAIAVSAFDPNDHKAWFSNYGTKIDVAAPGVSILSLRANGTSLGSAVNDQYTRLSGTSMACPHVSGLAALILSYYPELTNEEVRQILRVSADDIVDPLGNGADYSGFDIYSGYGRINADQALKEIAAVPEITSPTDFQLIKEEVEVIGNIKGGFDEWRLSYRSATDSSAQVPLASGNEDRFNYLWDTTNLANGSYFLQLKVFNNDTLCGADVVEISIDHDLVEGWPQYIGTTGAGSIYADVDNNGDIEILVANAVYKYGSRSVYLFNHDGSIMYEWSDSVNVTDATPALADLDEDGDLEVIMAKRELLNGIMGAALYAYHHTGELMWKNVYTSFGGNIYHSPVVADLDNDGHLEIIIGILEGESGTGGNKIFVFDHQGNVVSPFPHRLGDSTGSYGNETVPFALAVGDLDKDEQKEIVVATYGGMILAINTDAKLVWHKTKEDLGDYGVGSNWHSLALGDLDLDGTLEIVAGFRGIDSGTIYVFNYDGSVSPGWPKRIDSWVSSSPALGDIDGDGDLEIAIGDNNGRVWVLDDDGSVIFQQTVKALAAESCIGDIDGDGDLEITIGDNEGGAWALDDEGSVTSQQTVKAFAAESCIGDIDNDGAMEIITSSYDNSIYAWSNTGELLSGWPFLVRGYANAPAIGDINQDGVMDLVVTSQDGYVYVWTLNGEYQKDNLQWPMVHHDAQHTGCYDKSDLTPPSTPDVTDEGEFTFSTTALKADWSSSDNESGIAEYVYAIATHTGSTPDIVDWTSGGLDTSVTHNGLELTPDKTYYFWVKAKNGAGLESKIGYSDGITVIPLLTVSTKAVNLKLTIKDPSKGTTSADAFKITNEGVYSTTWQLYNNQDGIYTSPGGKPQSIPVQGFGFYEASGGIDGGKTATIQAYVSNTKPAGLYQGSYTLKQIQGGATIDAATISYSLEVEKAGPPPYIRGIWKDSGSPGKSAWIIGGNFGLSQGKVVFQGAGGTKEALTCRWDYGRYILFQIPALPAGMYKVQVITAEGEKSNEADFKIIEQPPHVRYIYPQSGKIGKSVLLYGKDFGTSQGKVVFQGAGGTKEAPIRGWRHWYIQCQVPDLPAGEYKIQIITTQGEKSNEVDFRITGISPQLRYIWPWHGKPGSYICVIGKDFGLSQGKIVFQEGSNRQEALIRGWHYGQYIVCKVPLLPSGKYEVIAITASGTRSNSSSFYIR